MALFNIEAMEERERERARACLAREDGPPSALSTRQRISTTATTTATKNSNYYSRNIYIKKNRER